MILTISFRELGGDDAEAIFSELKMGTVTKKMRYFTRPLADKNRRRKAPFLIVWAKEMGPSQCPNKSNTLW